MHMNRIRIHIFFLIVILAGGIQAQNPRSVFTDRPVDSAAVYFTPEYFPIKPDGSTDVSDVLQKALNTAKHKESGCGILFVPEGVYKLSTSHWIWDQTSGIRPWQKFTRFPGSDA